MDEIFLPVNSIVCAAANQDRNLAGAGQRSRSAVLTKRIAASGNENAHIGALKFVLVSFGNRWKMNYL